LDQTDELTRREWQVIDHLLEGKSNKMIASALNITSSTVEFHLKNIFSKFQVSSRTELILKLGKSTVAKNSDFSENNDSFNFWNWMSLALKHVERFFEKKMENTKDENINNEKNVITFFDSIWTCFKKYSDFQGSASRSEFWWFFLFIILVASVLVLINEILGEIFLILTLLPFLAVGSRRLRDVGKSAWELLYLLIPIAGLVILGIYWAQPSINQNIDV
jgi:DNA-binding CsgD family transcriptional regulator